MSKELFSVIETVVVFLMAKYGPDRHTDGSDVIAYGVLKTLGYDVEYPDDGWHDKEEVDEEIAMALEYHPNFHTSGETANEVQE